MIFSTGQAAREVRAFGADELSERALQIPETELPRLWQTAAVHYNADYPLPVTGGRITARGRTKRPGDLIDRLKMIRQGGS